MSARSRLRWLEEQLDRDDLTDLQYESYNSEANAIQDQLNKEKKEQEELKAKAMRERLEQEAYEKALSITDAEVDKMYSDFHILNAGQIDSNGRTFEEWFEQALALYSIVPTDKGISLFSKAKGEKEFEWTMVSVAHARSKILELIKIKFRDHHNRPDRQGCDFAHIPKSL